MQPSSPSELSAYTRSGDESYRRCVGETVAGGPADSFGARIPFRRHLSETSRTLTRVTLNGFSQRCPRRPSSLPKVALSNVRSISNKLDEATCLVGTFRPDVCIFTESWLDDSTPNDAVAIPFYSVARRDRRGRKGGGIICYIRSALSFYLIDNSEVTSLILCQTEFLIVYIKNFHLLVVCVYHPFWNDNRAHEEAISCLSDIVDFAFTKFDSNLRIVIGGDFNDLRNYFNSVASLTQLVPLVDFSTRGDHCLDQIFSNFATNQKPLRLPPLGKSDHVVIMWCPKPCARASVLKKKVRKFSQANEAAFQCAVASYDWLGFVSSFENLDEAVTAFLSCLHHLYDCHFPERTVRVRAFEPPWMKLSLKVLIDDRDRAFQNKQWSKYRRLRQEVICHIRLLKCKFLNDATSSHCSRKMWKSLRCLSRYRKHKFSQHTLSAEEFNEFFASNFQADPGSCDPICMPDSEPEPFPLFSEAEVFSCLRKVPNKSCGPDGVPPWIFRDCAVVLHTAVTHLFNNSLRKSYVPSCFKFANVIPIPKQEKPCDVTHYRPISLLPVLSKILEKLVVKKFLLPTVRDKVSPTQFAYIPRPGSGTIPALILAYHKIIEFLDSSSGAVRVLSVDFSKAFDKLLHSCIMRACKRFDIPVFVTEWIRCFLTSRRQRVVVDGTVSSWTTLSSGVPQGSVLGPVLFCLAVDSLTPVCPNSTVIKYADDVTFLHFIRSPSDDALQCEWNNLEKWSHDMMLPLNFLKCDIMNIVTKKNLPLPDIFSSDGHTIRNVDCLSFLGVTFCHNMRWNLHFEKITKKACKRFYILYNLRRSGCPADTLYKCFSAFIRPILSYGFPCFCNAPEYLLCKLLRIERRAFRIIGSNSFPSFKDVAEASCRKIITTIEKFPHHPLRDLFLPRTNRTTRLKNCLQPPRARTSRFSNSFIKYCK